MRYTVIVIVMLSSLFPVSWLSAQGGGGAAAPQIQEKVEVELNQIAFQVCDADGKRIQGLTKDDVHLLINGKERPIEYLDEVRAGDTTTQAGGPSLKSPRMLILVFDSSTTRPEALKKHKEQLHELIAGFKDPQAYFGIVSLTASGTFEMQLDMTRDKAAVLQAVDGMDKWLKPGAEDWELQLNRITSPERYELCGDSGQGGWKQDCIKSSLQNITRDAIGYARVLQSRNAQSLAVLQRFVQDIGKLPGYKTVVVLSEGIDPLAAAYAGSIRKWAGNFHDNVGEDLRRTLESDLRISNSYDSKIKEISQAIGRSSTTVYWVGVSKSGFSASQDMGGSSVSGDRAIGGDTMSQFLLKYLADQSGGAAYLSKDLKLGYTRLEDNLSSYYLLSYRPEGKGESANDAMVQVKKDNREVALLSRPIPPAPTEWTQGKGSLQDPSTVMQFATELHYLQRKGGEYHVLTGVGLPYATLKSTVKDGKVKEEVRLLFEAYDSTGKQAFRGEGKVPVEATAEDFAAKQSRNAAIEYLQRFDLKPGNYKLKVTATERSGRTATNEVALQLPDSSIACPVLAPLVLASSVSQASSVAQQPELTSDGQIHHGGSLLKIATRRELPPSGTLDGIYQLVGVSADMSLVQSFKLYHEDTFMNETTARPISGSANRFSVPYKNLAPGRYALEVVVSTTDSRCTTSSRSSFDVVPESGDTGIAIK